MKPAYVPRDEAAASIIFQLLPQENGASAPNFHGRTEQDGALLTLEITWGVVYALDVGQ